MYFLKKLIILILGLFVFFMVSCKESTETTPLVNKELTDSAYTKTIEFMSLDSLLVTADVYHIHKDSQTVVLCHQAGWSRGEYKEIAPKLNALGYNCIAIDQRSGNAINNIVNQTAKRAQNAGLGQTYNDAKQDIVAAVNFVASAYNKKVILWGSSYSSSLALIVATESNNVKAVLSFSPGEYLNPVNVKESIKGLNKPAFLTSSNSEQSQTKILFDAIASSSKTHFIPKGAGVHGASALWEEKADHAEYWKALEAFLMSL